LNIIPHSLDSTASHVFIVEERANPSCDFFVIPALIAQRLSYTRCLFHELVTANALRNAMVIFIRYVPSAWQKLISAQRTHIRHVIFFMDDDVLDASAFAGMPWRYQLKLMRLSASRTTWLQQYTTLWVSTPYLHHKYCHWQPRLLLPSSIPVEDNFTRIFYHGSATHKADIAWLFPVISEVLHSNEQLTFEIIGGQDVYRHYKKLPRVTIVHPMSWPSYQAFISKQNYHIGVNPLVNTPFNKARSYTKFFDITRCHAVGIYSPNSCCADVVAHLHEGLIIELNPADWVEAVLNLANDKALRSQLLMNAQQKVAYLNQQALQQLID